MATRDVMCLLLLPVDAQTSILSFLEYDDVVHFSAVSEECCDVATMDRVWSPLLAQHYDDLALMMVASLDSPFRKFRSLAGYMSSFSKRV